MLSLPSPSTEMLRAMLAPVKTLQQLWVGP
ncbi:hypothetical protein ABH975_005350 [Bradyrhizobium ottawaense]